MKSWSSMSDGEKLGLIAAVVVVVGDALALLAILADMEEDETEAEEEAEEDAVLSINSFSKRKRRSNKGNRKRQNETSKPTHVVVTSNHIKSSDRGISLSSYKGHRGN